VSREAGLNKAPDAFRTISEVAEELDLPQHVLRFWESRFPHIKPLKRGGGRRYYRPEDIDLLRGIRRLLYSDGYTIKGVQRILREQGVRTVQSVGQGLEMPNLVALPRDDASRDDSSYGEDGRNGAPAADGDAPAVPAPPQNGPIADANSATVASVTRLEAGRGDHAQPAADKVAARPVAVRPVAAGQVAQVALSQAAAAPVVVTAVAVKMPSPPSLVAQGLAAQDLDRLKRALAELEACRRELDKAIEGRGH
jgi:DNA-binding transcriptional MerR regulator